jgi:hypothetical protein
MGFLSVLGLFLPVFAHALEAQALQLEKERFLSFSDLLEESILRISHYAEGSSLSLRVPKLDNLSIGIGEEAFSLTWSPSAVSIPLERGIESPLPLVGEWSPDSDAIIISRGADSILIESG